MQQESDDIMIDSARKKYTLLALFMSASLIVSGCGSNSDVSEPASSAAAQKAEASDQDNKLVDDDGKEFTMTENDDGTETMTYEDGDSVTFEDQGDQQYRYVSGNSNLLPRLGVAYLLWHNNRRTSNNLRSQSAAYRDKQDQNDANTGTSGGGAVVSGGRSHSAVSSDQTTRKSGSASVSSHKGFGSAGARSGAS